MSAFEMCILSNSPPLKSSNALITMEKYLQQLFSDLRSAHRSKDSDSIPPTMTLEDEFSEIENWLSEGVDPNTLPLGKICGVEKSQFPPVEKLNSNQIEQICTEIDQLLFSWNITLNLPNSLPIQTAYKFHLQCFEEQIMIVDFGNVGFSFCNEAPEECIFGEHCSCIEARRKFEAENKLNEAKANFFIEKLAELFFSKAAVFQVKLNTSKPDFQKPKKTQSLTQWLGFENEQIPISYKITEEQTGAIVYFLMKLWDKNDRYE